ncbi:uncharacterized protein DC041_0000312 [Schistosoma bovis]|uniref:Grh/CP2 DB domain-containing protein n=1 Tax=Schistosoma bovis TaxID=6184 RepID=A0A430QH74_SCHBO|nr:uncharacterized protein DC041_0000312 [Schistosoma bovis]
MQKTGRFSCKNRVLYGETIVITHTVTSNIAHLTVETLHIVVKGSHHHEVSLIDTCDALSALPLCNDESKLSDDSNHEGLSNFSMLSSNSAQTVDNTFISMADTNSHLFDNILKAPTSSATRLGEASLTYLNQDYKRSNDYEELDNENTPSDDILCVWKYPKCTIGLRFNCVEHFEYDTNQHLGSFACQIKVFKMKGADRKHKTDRERIERKSGDGQPCLQRRRRLRAGDCCAGTCSSCGRSCRSASRWIRSNKNRMMCTNWDNSTNRAKQASVISERRRAAHSYENGSHLTEFPKSKSIQMNIPSHQSNSISNNHHSGVYELSTSGESSSLGNNDKLNKYTILDKYDDQKSKPSSIILPDYPLNSVVIAQSDEDPLLSMSSATPASRDMGYCSDLLVSSPSRPTVEDRVIEQIEYCTENNSNNNNVHHNNDDDYADLLKFEDLCMDKLNSVVHQATSCDSIVSLSNKPEIEIPSLSSSSLSSTSSSTSVCPSSINTSVATVKPTTITTSNISSVVHCEMTASQVADWLCQSNFENLLETFKNFTGCDILRLAKEDLLSICGSLEGLRLYNSLYNKPTVPRCTLYVCLKGETSINIFLN